MNTGGGGVSRLGEQPPEPGMNSVPGEKSQEVLHLPSYDRSCSRVPAPGLYWGEFAASPPLTLLFVVSPGRAGAGESICERRPAQAARTTQRGSSAEFETEGFELGGGRAARTVG